MSATIPTAILGATGYVSGEILRLVAGHPTLTLVAAVSDSRAGRPIAETFPHLGSVHQGPFVSHETWFDAVGRGSDLALFSAAPHGASAAILRNALEHTAARNINAHVVDVSADFRYAKARDYEAVYGTEHGAPELLASFDSGVPELLGETSAEHIGHPGCFATAVLLASAPLIAGQLAAGELFVNGITGSTGSGRQPQAGTHHPERHSNLYAYKALEHRHTPEIMAQLRRIGGGDVAVNFVPHSGPFARGIYVTVQAKAANSVTTESLRRSFTDFFENAAFVDVVDGMPKLKNVVASNRAEIGVAVSNGTLVVTSAIDNLVKGAAGGAVQWMNRLWGLPQAAGLGAPAPAWT